MRVRVMIAVVLVLPCIVASCGGQKRVAPETNIPISNEATLVEHVSACEIMVLASGIGQGKEKHLDSLASIDARKSAVIFALKGGTDPLLQTDLERKRFDLIQEKFFEFGKYREYVSYEQSDYEQRIFLDRKAKLKVQRHFKINRCSLSDYLVENGVIEPPDEIDLGMPQIAVIPAIQNNEDAIALLNDVPDLYHAGTVIESHLTALGYDVVLLSQSQQLDDLTQVTKYLKEAQTDNEYLAAACIGADVYLTYTVEVQQNMTAGQEVRKAISTVKAYETTTGRLLGSETGYYGANHMGAAMAARPAVIEGAINDAAGKVLSRVQAYWKKDIKRGIQYRMHFAFDIGMGADLKENTKFAIHRVLKDQAKIVKPKISTENSIDYLIWVDPMMISDFVELQMVVKSELKIAAPSVSLEELVSNLKLVIYELE